MSMSSSLYVLGCHSHLGAWYTCCSPAVSLSRASIQLSNGPIPPFSVLPSQAHCENNRSRAKALSYKGAGLRTFWDHPSLRPSICCPTSSIEGLSLFPSVTFIRKVPYYVLPSWAGRRILRTVLKPSWHFGFLKKIPRKCWLKELSGSTGRFSTR